MKFYPDGAPIPADKRTGAQAFLDGKPVTACPHRFGLRGVYWRRGWKLARRLERQGRVAA